MSAVGPLQVDRQTWLRGLRILSLPDVGDDFDRLAGLDVVGGYRSLAEALGSTAAGSCAVQVRLVTPGALAGSRAPVEAAMVIRADSRSSCEELHDLVTSALPVELVWRAMDESSLRELMGSESAAPRGMVEIRRRIEDADSQPGIDQRTDPVQPAVLGWAPEPWGLRHSAQLLSRQLRPAAIVLHMEPTQPSDELMLHVDQVLRDITADLDATDTPLRVDIARRYRSRLRDLPRAALQVRVLVVGETPLSHGLVTSVGMELTDAGGYELFSPSTEMERVRLVDLLATLRTERPGADGDPVHEMELIADANEAASVVRFPLPAYGGTIGLSSSPVPSLPRSADSRPRTRGEVFLGAAQGGGHASLTQRELNQHLVIAGLPGFGKSMTTQTILVQLAESGVPFLVLDPAKSDYRRMGRVVPGLRTYSLGPQHFAFNPFGVPANCPRTTHAGRVLAAFDAAFGLSRTWPAGYVTLARGLYAAYDAEETPTLDSLYAHLTRVIKQSGFAGPDGANIRASLLGRISLLASGPLGIALSAPPQAAVDWEYLLAAPSLVEMRGFAGPFERSLIFGLLLSGLISYREHNVFTQGLGHVTVLEEAHRLLRNNDGPDTEGVRMFVEAIAELRGSGEGFIVVDQAPTLLDPGVMKLAGSVCSHRLVEPTERTAVGSALLLDERQMQDLARLLPGQVVLHSSERLGSVVVDVQVQDGLLTPNDSCPSPEVQLPWRTGSAQLTEPAVLRARIESLAAVSSNPLEVFRDIATELAAEQLDAQQWRSGLDLITSTIKEFAVRRRDQAQPVPGKGNP